MLNKFTDSDSSKKSDEFDQYYNNINDDIIMAVETNTPAVAANTESSGINKRKASEDLSQPKPPKQRRFPVIIEQTPPDAENTSTSAQPPVVQTSNSTWNPTNTSTSTRPPVVQRPNSTWNPVISRSGIQAATNTGIEKRKNASLKELGEVLKITANTCMVCWTMFGEFSDIPPLGLKGHPKFFHSCFQNHLCGQFPPQSTFKWLELSGYLKTSKGYQYCYHCLFPRFAPGHIVHQDSCTHQDGMQLFAWSLFHKDKEFEEMCKTFEYVPSHNRRDLEGILDDKIRLRTYSEFISHYAIWLQSSSTETSLNNMINVFIWYYNTYHKSKH